MTNCLKQNSFLASIFKRSFHYLMLGTRKKIAYIQRNGKFLVYTHSHDHMATIGTVKSTLKIPPRHNGVIPVKICGPIIKTHMAYFLTDESTPKGRDPNINIISGIHKIKRKTSVIILVSDYTNKHLTFHKGRYIGHLEPAFLDSTDQQETHQTNSVTLKKMMSETVTPDMPLTPHAMNYLQLYRMTFIYYYKNMNCNLHKR